MTGGSPTLVQLVNPAPEVDSCSLVLTLVIPTIQENWKMRVHSGSDSIWGKYHLSSRDSSISKPQKRSSEPARRLERST